MPGLSGVEGKPKIITKQLRQQDSLITKLQTKENHLLKHHA
jgi:hypothetical protein